MTRRMLAAGLTAAIAAAAPAAAAVSKPSVSTGGAAQVTQTSATLTGKVNPNGAQTTYFFQYGTSKLYGATTGPADAGSGTTTKTATAELTGLAPFTTYHYRLVAQNAKGTSFGGDMTFKTLKQPLGLSLSASPNPATFGTGTTVAGQLTGTGNAGRAVQLQMKAFPYTADFTNVGNAQVTDAAGNFSFAVALVDVNTQFRVVTADKPLVESPIVIVGSAVRVHIHVDRTRVRRGTRVRFSGQVMPANDGALYAIQLLRRGVWVNVTGGSLRHRSASASVYRKVVRIRRAGQYRVFVGVNNQNTSGVSGPVRIRVHR